MTELMPRRFRRSCGARAAGGRGEAVVRALKVIAPALLLLAACRPTPAQAPAPASDAPVPAGVTPRASAPTVRPGIETFLADVPRALRGKRVGLITNHTGIDRSRTPDIDLIAKHKDLRLVALLAPEHGIRGTTEAGEKVVDETDPKTGVPVHSLY